MPATIDLQRDQAHVDKLQAKDLANGEAKVDRQEFRAGRDGHIGAREATRVAKADNRESARIHHQRHDAQLR